MLQRLLDETKLTAEFFGLELSQLEVHQWGDNGATGSCKVNGHVCQLPKVGDADNARNLVAVALLNFVNDFKYL